jgi:HD superfamily phosphohydrolase YqeK
MADVRALADRVAKSMLEGDTLQHLLSIGLKVEIECAIAEGVKQERDRCAAICRDVARIVGGKRQSNQRGQVAMECERRIVLASRASEKGENHG